MILAYKYRIKDKRAKNALLVHARAANQVWNWCVADHRNAQARYDAGSPRRKWPSQYELQGKCAGLGAVLGIHQQTVNGVCEQFVQNRNTRRTAPGFRSSYGTGRARGWIPFQPQSRQIFGNAVQYLGKRYRLWLGRRSIPSNAKSGFFMEDATGRWYVVFYADTEVHHASDGAVGIDLGLKALATTSAGEIIENPRHFRKYAERPATAQRAGNKRRAKALHQKIANARLDHHHKISRQLANEYAFIVVGDVNAKKLAKTRMAKSVLDAGWSSFRAMLAYKAARYVRVDEKFTTQTCSECGSLPSSRPKGIAGLGIRAWDCSDCGGSHDRDVNAARNILRLGRSVAPPVEESRRAA